MGFLGGAGMAGAAGGANDAFQNFLQFYLKRKDLEQENSRTKAQIAEAKVNEDWRKQQMKIQADAEARATAQRGEISALEQTLNQPVQGMLSSEIPYQEPALTDAGGIYAKETTPTGRLTPAPLWMPQAPVPQFRPDTVTTQVPTTFANQEEAWAAQGKDPLIEKLRMTAAIIRKYDPKEGTEYETKIAQLKSNNDIKEQQLEAKKLMLEMTNTYREAVLGLREKVADKTEARADADRRSREQIAALGVVAAGNRKGQITLPEAQKMANRDLEKEYTHDTLTGQWLLNGAPVNQEVIKRKYQQYVDKYMAGSNGAPKTNRDPLGIR